MKVYTVSERQPGQNLNQRPQQPPQKKAKVRLVSFKFITFIFIIIILLLAGGAYAYISHSLSHTNKSFSNGQGFSLSSFFSAHNVTLQGQDTDRTNVMIYGLTANGLRTDTIILVSYYWKEHKLAMLNIPRDLYVTYNGNNTKIVSLYSIAKDAQPNNQSYPPEYVSNFISQEYGIPIDYWVVANMNAFKQLVDAVGGVTINVPDTFTDYQYPTDDYKGYISPAPHFDAGIQTMDGTTALIYARSRHAAGPEGTDFARSKRQQVIIQAILSKLKQQGVFTDVSKIDSYLSIFGNNIFTNMTAAELIKSAQLASQLNLSQILLWLTGATILASSATLPMPAGRLRAALRSAGKLYVWAASMTATLTGRRPLITFKTCCRTRSPNPRLPLPQPRWTKSQP